MRRALVGGARRIGLGLLQPLAELRELPRQRVDLLPLRGDGLVQRLDGLVLIGEARLQRVDALGERLVSLIACASCPFGAARAGHGRARRARRTRSIRRASGSRASGTSSRYFRMPPLR